MTRRAGPFDAEAIEQATFVRRAEVYDEVRSTSDLARQRAASNDAESLPLLIAAARQTAGRGRSGARWWSADGALTFSVLIAPAEHGAAPDQIGALSITTALAICDAIDGLSDRRATIKWPNDVLLNGKKVSGVLLEAPRRDRLSIGVGVNVGNPMAAAPEAVRHVATSLADYAASPPSVQTVLVRFLEHFEKRLGQLAAGTLADEWNTRSELNGARVTLAIGDREATGDCVGLSAAGALRLRGPDGAVVEHVSGSVIAWETPPSGRQAL